MQLITALFHPEKYDELAKKKWYQVLFYILFWVFFVTLIVKLAEFRVNVPGKEELKEIIPEFQVDDGILQIQGDVFEFMDEKNSIYILADTSKSEFEKEELKEKASQEIYITKDKISIYLLGESYLSVPVSALFMDGMTKETLAAYIVLSSWIVVIFLILEEGILLFLQNALYVLMTVFIVDILAKFMGKRIPFRTLYQCGIYASTLGILCQLLRLWFIFRGVSYEPTVFYYLCHILTTIYMVQVVRKWNGMQVSREE